MIKLDEVKARCYWQDQSYVDIMAFATTTVFLHGDTIEANFKSRGRFNLPLNTHINILHKAVCDELLNLGRVLEEYGAWNGAFPEMAYNAAEKVVLPYQPGPMSVECQECHTNRSLSLQMADCGWVCPTCFGKMIVCEHCHKIRMPSAEDEFNCQVCHNERVGR